MTATVQPAITLPDIRTPSGTQHISCDDTQTIRNRIADDWNQSWNLVFWTQDPTTFQEVADFFLNELIDVLKSEEKYVHDLVFCQAKGDDCSAVIVYATNKKYIIQQF